MSSSKKITERMETGLIFLYVALFMISLASFVLFNPTSIAFSKYVNEAKMHIVANGYEAGAAWDKESSKNNDGTINISFKVDRYKWSSYSGKVGGTYDFVSESDIRPNYIGVIIGIFSLLGGVVLVWYVHYFNKDNKKVIE